MRSPWSLLDALRAQDEIGKVNKIIPLKEPSTQR